MRAKALSDLEARTATERAAQEAVTELVALTISERALCNIVLGARRGSALLASRLDEARRQVDPLCPLGFVVACLRP
jgi:hypothetical protein